MRTRGIVLVGLFVWFGIAAAARVTITPAPTTTATSTATPAPLPKIGETVTAGNWKYTVSKVARQKSVTWSSFGNKTDAKGIWQIVHVKLENIGKRTYTLNTWDFEVKSGDITFEAASDSISYSSFNNLSKSMDDYPPGVPAEIGLLFDVNPEAKGLTLWLVQAKVAIDLGQ